MDERRRFRGSIFFPLVLIILGVIFLLNNIGVLTGDVWNTILQLWPVLLIALGLDTILRRQGLVGPVFLIGLGIVFLLANYGLLAVNVWDVVLRLWPVLLVAIGLDIVIGRRSPLLSLVGLVLVLAVLAGALWLYGVRFESGQVLNSEQISQAVGAATAARVVIEPAAGSLRITAMSSPDGLVEGTAGRVGQEKVVSEYSISGGTATFTLRGTGGVFISVPRGNQGEWNWNLALTPAIPIDLKTSLGAGQSLIDLTGLDISALDANLGVGQTTVVLPSEGDFEGKVEGAIGQIVIQVPKGMALRIRSDTGLATIDVPNDFMGQNDVFTSPGFTGAQHYIDLQVGQAIGNVNVRYAGP